MLGNVVTVCFKKKFRNREIDVLNMNIYIFFSDRVQYPIQDWIKFSEILQKSAEVMSSSDRTSLINDAFALAACGRLEYAQALDLTLYLGPNERYIAPWTTAFLAIDNMADVLYFDPLYVR